MHRIHRRGYQRDQDRERAERRRARDERPKGRQALRRLRVGSIDHDHQELWRG